MNRSRPWSISLRKTLIIGLCVLPAAGAFYMMCTHWVPVPYWDEWDSPGQQLAAYYRGTLRLSDLFSQHNESRSFFQRLLSLSIYLPAGWDVRYGMVLSFAMVCAGSAGLYQILRRTNPSSGAVLFIFAAMNFLLFAPRQYQNFLHAIMIEEFAPACVLIFALLINLSDRSLKAKTLMNAALAFVATYTFANGMLLWLLAFPLETTRVRHARTRVFWRMVYLLVAAASIAGYLISYRHPPITPPYASSIAQVPALLQFLLVWLGSLLSVGAPALCGAVVLLLFLGLTAAAIRQMRWTGAWRAHYAWLVLGCYTLISGCVVAIGRIGFNYSMAGDVRYAAFTAFIYVAVVGLGFSVYARAKPRPLTTRITIFAATVTLVVISAFWVVTFKKERRLLRAVTDTRQHCLLVLRWSEAIPQNPEIALLSPYPVADVLRTIHTLAENDALRPRLVSRKLAGAVNERPNLEAASAGHLDAARIESAGQLAFQGWARVPDEDRPADCIVLGVETPDGAWNPFCVVLTGGSRPDVARHFGHAALERAGFSGRIDATSLPRGDINLKAWAIDLQNERAFPIAGAVSPQLSR
ncbi:MAG: hypothetical protein LC642_04530 [Verrucomicrobiaceae bacterium]|nr:hypothetical protein [Verrucomicrobiaceae bacterium]